jgi:hypothetical protein
MILLGLTGPKGCGKDTAFNYLHKWASERGVYVIRRGFADKLKFSAYRVFYPQCSLEQALSWADADKNDPDRYVQIGRAGSGNMTISLRMFLQHYGTESHRGVFGDDFWVDALLPEGASVSKRPAQKEDLTMEAYGDPAYLLPGAPVPPGYSEWKRCTDSEGVDVWTPLWQENFPGADIAVITDARFVNEAERIHAVGGEIWKIERGAVQADDQHVSENGLPSHMIDGTITNNYTLDAFEVSVRDMADRHLIPALDRQKAQP